MYVCGGRGEGGGGLWEEVKGVYVSVGCMCGER